ncbi:hypothetical protein E2C01_084911 [Portunus trituberculatus]|uniref:Uncharacterized protein n=1 Tax=Portunus trituberculatus TaxID=210409 RepID=A0A5B7J911_PORTR|nr:hypothetical protein [Portunus trituberculatus]
MVSVGSGRRRPVGSNHTTYHLDTLPFFEWFKVTHMSPGYPGLGTQGTSLSDRRAHRVLITGTESQGGHLVAETKDGSHKELVHSHPQLTTEHSPSKLSSGTKQLVLQHTQQTLG